MARRFDLRLALWLLIVLSLVPAGILVVRRVAAEGTSQYVAVVMDEQALADQANLLGTSSFELGLRYQGLGLTGVALYEDTLESLASRGAAAVLLGSDARALAAARGDPAPDVPGDSTLATALAPGALDDLLHKTSPAPHAVELGGRTWYVFPGDVASVMPAGPDRAALGRWADAGFDIAYRPRNAPYSVVDPGSDFPGEAHYLVYAGLQVTGFPGNLGPVVQASQPYLTALIEGTPQDGIAALLRKVPTVRLLSFNQDYVNRRLRPADLIDKYLLAVNERNIRLLYLRPYTTTELGDPIANTEALVQGLSRALQRQGYSVGPLRTTELDYTTGAVLRAGAAVGIVAGLVLLGLLFPGVWGVLVALGVAALGVAAGGPRWDAFALMAALTFPVLGYGMLRKNVGSVLLATLVSLLGAALLSAVGSDRETMLAIRPFAGVGATLVVPPALYLLHHALRFRRPAAWVRDLWSSEVRVGHVALALVVLGALALAFLRRGNTPVVTASSTELAFRQWLTDLFVRPRFKELIGHPLAVLALANPRWPQGLRGLLLTGGVLAQASILNTFSHYHTPLWISLQRTLIGLGLGLVLGLACVVLARLLVRLVGDWLRAPADTRGA